MTTHERPLTVSSALTEWFVGSWASTVALSLYLNNRPYSEGMAALCFGLAVTAGPVLLHMFRAWWRRRRNRTALAKLSLDLTGGEYRGSAVKVTADCYVQVSTALPTDVWLDLKGLKQAVARGELTLLRHLGDHSTRADLARLLKYGRVEKGRLVFELFNRRDARRLAERLDAATQVAAAIEPAAARSPGDREFHLAQTDPEPSVRRAAAQAYIGRLYGQLSGEAEARVATLVTSEDAVVRLAAARVTWPLPGAMLAGLVDDGRESFTTRAAAMRLLRDRIAECPPDAVEEQLSSTIRTARGTILTDALEALAKLGRPPDVRLVTVRYSALPRKDRTALLDAMRRAYGESVHPLLARIASGTAIGTLELADGVAGGELAVTDEATAGVSLSPIPVSVAVEAERAVLEA